MFVPIHAHQDAILIIIRPIEGRGFHLQPEIRIPLARRSPRNLPRLAHADAQLPLLDARLSRRIGAQPPAARLIERLFPNVHLHARTA